jgi:hypothetical protein
MRVSSTPILDRYLQRFRRLRQELAELGFFCKGTVLERRMKCGQPHCACHRDPRRRHGPYWEWTYKAQGQTVNLRLSPEAASFYQAATPQYRQLKSTLGRMQRLSRSALAHQAKGAHSSRSQ